MENWEYKDTPDFCKSSVLIDVEPSTYFENVCYSNELQDSIIDLHRQTRNQYKDVIVKVGHNIYPLIIARDHKNEHYADDIGRQAIGGVYSLYLRNGSVYTITPTSWKYELMKAVGHLPLGMFTIVGPYLDKPKSDGYLQSSNNYLRKVEYALKVLEKEGSTESLTEEEARLITGMIQLTEDFLKTIISKTANGYDAFLDYTLQIKPFVIRSMDLAAKYQVDDTLPELLKWKEMLGEEEWSKLYAAVTTVWPVEDHSVRTQLLRSVMDPKKVDTNLIHVTNISDLELVRKEVGRIVADRLLARLAFHPKQNDRGERLLKCLSSHTDLVSDSCYNALSSYMDKSMSNESGY